MRDRSKRTREQVGDMIGSGTLRTLALAVVRPEHPSDARSLAEIHSEKAWRARIWLQLSGAFSWAEAD